MDQIPEAPQGVPVTLTVGIAVNLGVVPIEVPPPSGPAGNRRRPEVPVRTLVVETAGSPPVAGRSTTITTAEMLTGACDQTRPMRKSRLFLVLNNKGVVGFNNALLPGP